MKISTTLIITILVTLVACNSQQKKSAVSLSRKLTQQEFIEGKPQYLTSPFVAAGDRVYMVGYQNGSFPDLGWHIDGEMGGIWDHPIKLMDGFSVSISLSNNQKNFCLNQADTFVNYPVGNKHIFNWKDEGIVIERVQFVPDSIEGAIIEFIIINKKNTEKEINFSFTGLTDLRPTWLGERTNMIDAEDDISFDEDLSAAVVKDKNSPWFVCFGSTLKCDQYSADDKGCALPTKGSGIKGTLNYHLSLPANSQIVVPIFIAGSYQSESVLKTTFDLLKLKGSDLLEKKIKRFKTISKTGELNIPDKKIQQMYTWLKYNTEWLVRDVPELGVGLSAGLPDYPWWFGCDNTYALQGVLATGNHELVKNTILLLSKLSKQTNNNGRIVHEVSTNGAVYNPGNVNETAQFITLIRNYYAWTGDKELVKQLFPEIKKGIEWLRKEKDPDGNGYPNGSGMMEIPGLDTEMIDVASYTQQALACAAELALALGDQTSATSYQKSADDLRQRINTEWWQEHDKSFADFRGTIAEAKPVLQAALIRADTLKKPWAVAELRETKKQLEKYPKGKQVPHVIYHNWVVNTPLETGIADKEKAEAALKTAKKYENPFGVFVTGIDRIEETDSLVLKSRRKIFSYTGAVMTLPTGVQAVAAARYGTPEDALRYITKLSNSFSYALPGSMYEVSPDFGMITQAWNVYAVAVPVVNYFFGVTPDAPHKSVILSPRMPASWKDASLNNVRVGNNTLNISVNQKNDHLEYALTQTQPNWAIVIEVKKFNRVLVNGKTIEAGKIQNGMLKVTGGTNVISLY
jgi:glycogen debranching enzyme